MKSPKDMRVIQIDITNACPHRCSNCTRFCGHHEKSFFMDFDTFKRAVDSMEGFVGIVGMMGGEPTLHPEFERFARYLDSKDVPVWIRHVAVPGITDDRELLYRLGRFLGTLGNVQALEVLPYHTMGLPKYKELGIPYPLEGVPPMEKQAAADAREVILKGMRAGQQSCGMPASRVWL